MTMTVEIDPTFAAVRRLEPQALAELHDRYYPVVFRYVAYRLDDHKTVEDVVSDVFLSLLHTLRRQPDEIRDLRAWIMGAAHHQVQDVIRRKYRRGAVPLEDFESLPDTQQPESDVEQRLQIQLVQRMLPHLTEEQQHVLALRFSQELSVDETAQMMGKTVSAVKVLQFRALAALRRLLEGK